MGVRTHMVSARQDRFAESSGKTSAWSERDLRKLRRIDLLELLIEQIRENEQQAHAIDDLNAMVSHLETRLNESNDHVDRLLKIVDDREKQIKRLERRNAALAHAAGLLDADEILEIADIAVDIYMDRVAADAAGGDPSKTAPVMPVAVDDSPVDLPGLSGKAG